MGKAYLADWVHLLREPGWLVREVYWDKVVLRLGQLEGDVHALTIGRVLCASERPARGRITGAS